MAALVRDSGRPALVVCQDDLAARRMQEELKGLYSLATVLENSLASSLEESFEGGCGLKDLREDVCQNGLSAEELLQTALREDGYFHVPRTVEGEA